MSSNYEIRVICIQINNISKTQFICQKRRERKIPEKIVRKKICNCMCFLNVFCFVFGSRMCSHCSLAHTLKYQTEAKNRTKFFFRSNYQKPVTRYKSYIYKLRAKIYVNCWLQVLMTVTRIGLYDTALWSSTMYFVIKIYGVCSQHKNFSNWGNGQPTKITRNLLCNPRKNKRKENK